MYDEIRAKSYLDRTVDISFCPAIKCHRLGGCVYSPCLKTFPGTGGIGVKCEDGVWMAITETKGREAEIRERLEDIRKQERELAAELRRLEDTKVVNSVWPRRFRVRVESWKTLTDDGGEVKFPSFDTSITLFFDIYEDGSRILVGAQQEEGHRGRFRSMGCL